jgi:DNA-binding transcriptional LysR family regulator
VRIDQTIELTYLKYFFAVAKSGGFSKASRLLHVQQPSVTRGVQNLEEQLGVVLFERRGKAISLTRAGREILESCERIFQEARGIQVIADAEKKECKGPLKFAVANPISTHLIPEILESYLKKYPDVWPQAFVGSAQDLMTRIANADLEFGLFFYAPSLSPELQLTPLEKIRFHLVVATPFKSDSRVKARFIGSREIEDSNSPRLPTLERLKKDVPQAKLAISTNDISAHREMVLRGLGVSILPEFMIVDDLKDKRLVDLYPQEDWQFSLKLLTRKQTVLSRPAQAFLEEMKNSFR